MKIPTHPEEWQFDSATITVDGPGYVSVDLAGRGAFSPGSVAFTPGGAVLLAEQLLKAARKASA